MTKIFKIFTSIFLRKSNFLIQNLRLKFTIDSKMNSSKLTPANTDAVMGMEIDVDDAEI